MSALDVARIRNDFPILTQKIRGKPLIYLDNAASSQKPVSVIDAISNNYRFDYANIHRGVHTLSQRSTDGFEGAREKIRAFLNAESVKEIIFVRGATEGITLSLKAMAVLLWVKTTRLLLPRWSITLILCHGRCCVSKLGRV